MSIDIKKILAEVQENIARRQACLRHRFDPPPLRKLGEKHTCLECGCTMSGPHIMFYIEGYEAAGGHCDDIWPGFRETRNAN